MVGNKCYLRGILVASRCCRRFEWFLPQFRWSYQIQSDSIWYYFLIRLESNHTKHWENLYFPVIFPRILTGVTLTFYRNISENTLIRAKSRKVLEIRFRWNWIDSKHSHLPMCVTITIPKMVRIPFLLRKRRKENKLNTKPRYIKRKLGDSRDTMLFSGEWLILIPHNCNKTERTNNLIIWMQHFFLLNILYANPIHRNTLKNEKKISFGIN